MRIDPRYNYKTTPVAFEHSVVMGDKYRFTVLTSKLIRIEFSENGNFEDRATQTVVNREFDKVDFSVEESDTSLVITTEHIKLSYQKGKPFSRHSLNLCYIGELSHHAASDGYAGNTSTYWYFGDCSKDNLKGTTRTLDGVDGSCGLEDGIMSGHGRVCVLDDSTSLTIGEDGWVDPRSEDCVDMYLFCYADKEPNRYDYLSALKAFYRLTGKTPLLPRYILGNWWSRYYEYTQQEYLELMDRFKAEDIPFSVSVIDMDWHYVKIDPKYGNGWTGYTWNTELFPDHVEFLKKLHDEGLHATLNVHPQDGLAAHEKAYPKMAEAMEIDPKTEQRVEFDITDPKFLEKYFEIMHHPLEDEGVDFWWIDWQQGNTTSVPGLDPLWMLNHYHYIDNARNGKRPLAFSRYAGPGSHRYPIGFSGDTHMTWASLDFQPYFTANAANIGYGWWSHDIGGHMCGSRDEELTARWIQFGAFSPINRLHSGKNEFTGKEPWKFNKINELSMKKFLKLRHELIPYLYTMNYRAHAYDEPLIQPLYYKFKGEDAKAYKNEYCFGTEMIVSPITSPADHYTIMGSADTYFPEGVWYDFFSGRRYLGGRKMKVYRDIYNMPVFVKAGGIIPMAKLSHVNDTENPQTLKIKVFAGANNTFELYEDDGISLDFEIGKFAITKMELDWKNGTFTFFAPQGDIGVIPQNRSYEVEFVGFDGLECDNIVCCHGIEKDIVISLGNNICEKKNDTDKEVFDVLQYCQINNNQKVYLHMAMTDKSLSVSDKFLKLNSINPCEDVRLALTEIITADVK